MSLAGFSNKDRRTALMGAVVVSTLLLIGKGIPRWLTWQHTVREEAAAARTEASASQTVVRDGPAMTSLLRVGEQRYVTLAPMLLDGATPATGAAELTSAVSDAAVSSGVQVGMLQATPDSTSIGVGRVTLRVSATGDVDGLMQFIATLESGTPLIAIRALTITQPEPGLPDDRPETLQIDITLDALARPVDRDDVHLPASSDASIMMPVTLRDSRMTLPDVFVYRPATLVRAADSAAAFDVFRLARKPTRVAFGTPPAPPTPPPPTRPPVHLVLGGIVGPPWKAIVSGIPGREGGVVVAAGDTVGGLRIRAVRANAVVVQSPDTTWTLTTTR